MAMLVSTSPPELIVRTKRKTLPMRRDDAPFLCDRFWECVLNDYVDEFLDSSEDDIVARSPSRGTTRMNQKVSRKKKAEKIKKHGDILVEIFKDDELKASSKIDPTHSAKQASSGDERAADPEPQVLMEPETVFSNDHEMDQREKDIVQLPRSNDLAGSEPTPPNEVIVKQPIPAHTNNRYRKLDARVSSTPTELLLPSKLGKGFSNARDYGPEEETDQPTEIRKKGSPEVIHYAPLYLGQHATSSTRRSRGHVPHLPTESRSTQNSRRVAVDPDEHRPPSGRVQRTRDISDAGHTQSSSMNFLPRGPSNARGAHPLHPRSTDPRNNHMVQPKRNHTVQPKHDGTRVETIDLTNGRFLEPLHSPLNREGRAEHDKEDASGKFKECEDTVNWMLLESKKAESDYRRRKLDRKEALDRIRAIKARLQTVDP